MDLDLAEASEEKIGLMDRKTLRKRVITIAWPAVVELFLVSLFGSVDMIMVGRLGAVAITSVGLTNQPIFLIMAVFQALNIGGTALVARAFGGKNYEDANEATRHLLIITGVLSFIVLVPALIYVEEIYRFMGADQEVVQIGLDYFKVALVGVFFQNLALAIAAVMRGAGDTRTPMVINIISNLANMVLNYVLIFGYYGFPKWGVTGAGVATTISRIISFLWLTGILMKGSNQLKLSLKSLFHWNQKIVNRLVQVGFPSAIEQLVLRVGNLFFAKIVAGLGIAAYAAHQISISILNLSFTSGMAFGMAASTLIGQSLGAEEKELAEAYGKEVRYLGSVTATLIGVVFFFFSKPIVALFTNDPEVIEQAAFILKVIAVIQPCQSAQLILAGALRGAGDTKWPLYSTFAGIWGIRLSLSYLFVFKFHWGLLGAWLGITIDQVIRYGLLLVRFKQGKWKHIHL